MTKFATKNATIKPPVGTIKTRKGPTKPDAQTYNGADGWTRKPKSELFLLAVTNLVSESTFYESGKARDSRFVQLIHQVTKDDPEWVANFVPYLRDKLFMRTASLVMAAEYVRAGGPNGRKVVASAISRAEEPSVLMAYWLQEYGKRIPQPIKRGVADAVIERYTEKSLIKWDSDNLTPRFGDVIELVHPKGKTPWQHSLFSYAMDKRHNREDLDRNTESLPTIRAYRKLMALPVAERRPLLDKASESGDFSAFEGAGLTWENFSGWLQGPMDAKAWEAIIPQMQYMALLRNLRNFDDAKISDEARAKVIAKLTDPVEVSESKQLPLRFMSAYRNVAGMDWLAAIEKALNLSLLNVPQFKGRTLILVDISVSMSAAYVNKNMANKGKRSTGVTPSMFELAALFGSALALRAEKADLFAYSDSHWKADFRKGGSILRTVDQFRGWTHGGTNTWGTLGQTFEAGKHDRVVVLTDEQHNPGQIPKVSVPIYVANLMGYGPAGSSSDGAVYTFGGLSDKLFLAMTQIEEGKDGTWPFID